MGDDKQINLTLIFTGRVNKMLVCSINWIRLFGTCGWCSFKKMWLRIMRLQVRFLLPLLIHMGM